MNEKDIIQEIKIYVKNKLANESSGHDYFHTIRVYNIALDICKKEKEAHIFTVELGALLHDIADHKFGYSDEDRTKIISDILKSYDVSQKIINDVVYIANNISFKGGKNNCELKTIESKIVQDADRLDAIGAIGIARTFAFGGHFNRLIYNPDSNEENADTISHFYEKLLLLKDKMNTESGKQKAQARHEYMENYLKEFYSEWNGEL